MENFYITLPSTASCDIYPNTQSHFRVQLPQPIELEGKWKVGLSEIHLPIAYDNIDAKTDLFHIHVSEKETENRNVTIQIPSFKFFGTVIEVYRSLFTILQRPFPRTCAQQFRFNCMRQRISFNVY